jgi:hypothetical protein
MCDIEKEKRVQSQGTPTGTHVNNQTKPKVQYKQINKHPLHLHATTTNQHPFLSFQEK